MNSYEITNKLSEGNCRREHCAAKPKIDFESSFKVIEAWRAIAAAGEKPCFTTFADCVLPEQPAERNHPEISLFSKIPF
jgi:hypothetical protein